MSKPSLLSAVIFFLAISFVGQKAAAQTQTPSTRPLGPAEINQLKTSAQSGDPTSQLNLGKAYEDGNGVPQSDSHAVKWYRAAAEQGNSTAQNDVGLMFRLGRGVEQDKLDAVNWYKKAAKQENPKAMFNLGTAYYNGDGVASNELTAYAWFLLAQNFHGQSAIDAVKRMKEEAGSMEPDALEKIGDMYEKGDDLPRSSAKAIGWYRKAAPSGSPRLQMKLANLLFHDPDATADYSEVKDLCESAAKLKYPPGSYCMGELYDHGWGVEHDLPKAAKWFTEAASAGYAAADLRLGEMYWKGEGLKEDKIYAYAFIFLASTAEVPGAKQQKETLEKELTPKEVAKGKKRAVEWAQQHPSFGLRRIQ